MKKFKYLLLSFLIFCQLAICGNVPEELVNIYGENDPCVDIILKQSADSLRTINERDFELYKMQNEKCENYKKALIDLQSAEKKRYGKFKIDWGDILNNVIGAYIVWIVIQMF